MNNVTTEIYDMRGNHDDTDSNDVKISFAKDQFRDIGAKLEIDLKDPKYKVFMKMVIKKREES